MVNSPEGFFLKRLFDRLNSSGICYAVMRNYESLPHGAGGSDLDILVPKANYLEAQDLLLDCITQVEGKLIGCVKTWNFFEVYVIGFNEGRWWGVCVEIYCGVAYKSCAPLLNLECLDEFITKHNDVSVIKNDVGNSLGYIKEIMAHDVFRSDKPQYIASLRSLLSEQHNVYIKAFSSLGGRALSLLPSTLEVFQTRRDKIRAVRAFRRAVLFHAFISNPFGFVWKRGVHEAYRVLRYLAPPGTVIAILGVDGAGKSTVINAIKPALDDATHKAIFVQHLRPTLLPPLARLKGKKIVNAGPNTDPHGQKASGSLGSLFRLLYLCADYVLGHWVKIRPLIAKRPAIVVFDRYAYDIAIDPHRFRISLPKAVMRFFVSFAPKPDLIICLHGDPSVIAARKQELPLDEVIKQVTALKAFAAKEPCAILVSTEGSIDEARDHVLNAISEFCARREKGKARAR